MQYIFELVNKGKGTYGKDGIQLVEEDLLLLKEPPPEGSGLPNGGTTNQVLTKNSNTDQDASWKDPATTGTGGGLELVPFSSVILMTGNFKSVHTQAGAIAYTRTSTTPETNFANRTEHYIKASGTHTKPTFSANFVKMLDNWNNGVDKWNMILFKALPSGKVGYWIYDIS